jgi:hypothetical protein
MLLDGWIGLKNKARERHVFTLPAETQTFRLESREKKLLSARLRWPAQIGFWNRSGENIYRIDINSYNRPLTARRSRASMANQSQPRNWPPYPSNRCRASTMHQLSNIAQETYMKILSGGTHQFSYLTHEPLSPHATYRKRHSV